MPHGADVLEGELRQKRGTGEAYIDASIGVIKDNFHIGTHDGSTGSFLQRASWSSNARVRQMPDFFRQLFASSQGKCTLSSITLSSLERSSGRRLECCSLRTNLSAAHFQTPFQHDTPRVRVISPKPCPGDAQYGEIKARQSLPMAVRCW